MTRRSWKALLLATMTVMLCVLIISGATFALFTDNVTFTNHLEAGKLDVTLTRTKLEWVSVNSNGYLEKHTNTTSLDLSTVSGDNVFGLTNDSLIAPLSYYEATLVIGNNGNVAFNYGVQFKLNSTSNKLAEQLKVTVTDSSNQTVFTGWLSNMASGTTIPVKTTALNAATLDNTNKQSETFKVKVEFVDDGRPTSASPATFVNNEAMSLTANFDLIVTAVQNTTIVNGN